jgi:hypothetical protein
MNSIVIGIKENTEPKLHVGFNNSRTERYAFVLSHFPATYVNGHMFLLV